VALFITCACHAAEMPKLGMNSRVVVDSEDAACEVLKAAVVRQQHLSADTPKKWQWFCDFTVTKNDYLRIIGLRAGRCNAASCLIGWYAVMRRSTVVLEYDVAEDRVVPLDIYP